MSPWTTRSMAMSSMSSGCVAVCWGSSRLVGPAAGTAAPRWRLRGPPSAAPRRRRRSSRPCWGRAGVAVDDAAERALAQAGRSGEVRSVHPSATRARRPGWLRCSIDLGGLDAQDGVGGCRAHAGRFGGPGQGGDADCAGSGDLLECHAGCAQVLQVLAHRGGVGERCPIAGPLLLVAGAFVVGGPAPPYRVVHPRQRRAGGAHRCPARVGGALHGAGVVSIGGVPAARDGRDRGCFVFRAVDWRRGVPLETVEDPVCGGQGAGGGLAQRRLDVVVALGCPAGDVREAVLGGVQAVGAGDQERDGLGFDLPLPSAGRDGGGRR